MEISELLNQSQRLLVITGAGCSTASGIGDYRDESGAWKRVQPVQHQDFVEKESWRCRYWARSQVGFPQFMRARPNTAHNVLSAWEETGRLQGLITQNVDRLHQRAGHRKVIDLHGRLDEIVCMSCGNISSRFELQSWLDKHNPSALRTQFQLAPDGDADISRADFSDIRIPYCAVCEGMLKPNVVFFGDSVPKARVEQAYDWVDAADALLIVGSSLMVYSSFRFVRRAHQRQIPIAAINRGKTRADDLLTCKLEQDCGVALEQLASRYF